MVLVQMNIPIILLLILVLLVLLIIVLILPYPGLEVSRIISFFKPHNNGDNPGSSIGKKRIAIVTAEDRDDEYIRLHDSNVFEYCTLHDYDYIRTTNCDKSESSTYWCKVNKVNVLLDEYDYVMWLDSDTIILNNTPLESIISEFKDKDVMYGMNNVGILNNIAITVNAGVFIIKNSQIGKDFITDLLTRIKNLPLCVDDNNKETGLWAGVCYEEGLMNILIKGKKYSRNSHIDRNKYILNIIGDKVPKIENQFILHLAGWDNTKRKEIFQEYSKNNT